MIPARRLDPTFLILDLTVALEGGDSERLYRKGVETPTGRSALLAVRVGAAPLNPDSRVLRGGRTAWGGRGPVRTALCMATGLPHASTR